MARVELNRQALTAVFLRSGFVLPGLGPGDVVRAGAVAGFARDVDFRPGRGIAVLGQIVILLQIGRVTLGAHVVPCLVPPRPVKRIGVRHLLVWIKMKPLLAALLSAARIPGESKTLKAAVWKRHKVLLQGVDAECVRDGKIIELAVGPVRANVMFAVL